MSYAESKGGAHTTLNTTPKSKKKYASAAHAHNDTINPATLDLSWLVRIGAGFRAKIPNYFQVTVLRRGNQRGGSVLNGQPKHKKKAKQHKQV